MSNDTVYGLDEVRRQPAIYLGPQDAWHSYDARLLQFIVGAFVQDTPTPPEVRVQFLGQGMVTVASDGAPLPLVSSAHVDLHRHFTDLLVVTPGLRTVLHGAAVVNALCQMLTVFTVNEGECRQIVFMRAKAAKPLAPAPRAPRRGNFWFTYRGDATILGDRRLTIEQASDLARFHGSRSGVRVVVEDRSNDPSQKS